MKNKQELEIFLQTLLSHGYEHELVEFKEAKHGYDLDKLGKYFSALSNEANLKDQTSAWLVFGIDDNKNIVGSQFRAERAKLDSLKLEVAQNTDLGLTFIEIYEVFTEKGRVVLFEIPMAPKGIPIAWKGHYYGRHGESLTALNTAEYEKIRSQAQSDWSAKIIEDASLEDLSPDAIAKARNNYLAKNPKLADEIATWDDITFLNKAKLCIKGKITHTAILLLGKNESEHFISPAIAQITWILKDRDNMEKDYQHFSCPFLLNVEEIYQKIRNLKYRYIANNSLFPEEVDRYDPYVIREILNNCIAHQDYTLRGRTNVVEYEDDKLIFVNMGDFIPKNIEEVLRINAPEPMYRNPFLLSAMINLNMIDAIGSGIKNIFDIQRKRFFPLPDYEFANRKVQVTITGKILDMNYARKLATLPDLSIFDVIALDKVAKHKELTADETALLKDKQLIEGRKPNFYISAKVANITGEEIDYIKQRGIDDNYCQKIILDYIELCKEAKTVDLARILLEKLPDVLSETQKKNKIRNILQKLKNKGLIYPDGRRWKLSANQFKPI
jgi:ATP-dependent DNA helicase RecG